MSSSSSSLHEEMLIDILTRLPPKSLLRCLSVSKSFHSLITTPTFISAHITRRRRRRKLLLRHYSWSHAKERFTIHNPDYSFFSSQEEELDFGFQSYAKYFEIVGSVNGLLCLCDTHRVNSHTVYLWNPTIRKSIVLPPPSVDFKRVSNFVHGFGFDSGTRDYKVVKVTYPSHLTVSSPEIEIYELSKNSWRKGRTESDDETTPYCNRVISELSGQAFLHGAIHWVGYSNRAEFRGLGIVALDLESEGFRELKLPECLVELSTLKLGLMTGAESEEELSLVEYYGGGVRRNQWVQHGGCGVWVMREYGVESSWMKRFNVEVCEGGVGKALRLRKDEESAVGLLMASSSGEMVCLNGDGGIVELGMEGIPQSFHLEDLTETLVLI